AADLLKVGPVEVAGFKSKASVTRAPGAEPQRSSSMEFSLMKVGDTPVGVRDGQFVVAGTTLPLSGFAPAQKALADAGVSVEVVQATKTDDGVVSPGIQITRQQDAAAAGLGSASGSGDGAGLRASAGSPAASDGGSATASGGSSAPATAGGSVDASLASAPIATGPIAPLSSWSFFPMLLLAGASVAVVALGRRLLVRS